MSKHRFSRTRAGRKASGHATRWAKYADLSNQFHRVRNDPFSSLDSAILAILPSILSLADDFDFGRLPSRSDRSSHYPPVKFATAADMIAHLEAEHILRHLELPLSERVKRDPYLKQESKRIRDRDSQDDTDRLFREVSAHLRTHGPDVPMPRNTRFPDHKITADTLLPDIQRRLLRLQANVK